MMLGKIVGRVGFAFGMFGAILFYSSPIPFLCESQVICPLCPHVDIAFATKMTWIGVGMWLGLVSGLAYALVGFAMGYGISMVRDRHRQLSNPAN
jgi:hypothetical protein